MNIENKKELHYNYQQQKLSQIGENNFFFLFTKSIFPIEVKICIKLLKRLTHFTESNYVNDRNLHLKQSWFQVPQIYGKKKISAIFIQQGT